MHPYVHCSIIYNHQDLEAAQVSIGRGAGKKAAGHLHNGTLYVNNLLSTVSYDRLIYYFIASYEHIGL